MIGTDEDRKSAIGDVFTPPEWGAAAAKWSGVLDCWLAGGTVLDPTMGEGNLLESLVLAAEERGLDPASLPFETLYGNELNTRHFQAALEKFRTRWNRDMSSNFSNLDFFDYNCLPFDAVFGNPPWTAFADLPSDYKDRVRGLFHHYDLVSDSRKLLLGGSRIDIAALVVQKAIGQHLRDGGIASFFLPLSLLLNDGAHERFRACSVNGIPFSILSVKDFAETNVFGVSTRSGLVVFRRGESASYPIPYERLEGGQWIRCLARPLFAPTDPLSVYFRGTSEDGSRPDKIRVRKDSKPRQGINSCGANEVFFFDRVEPAGDGLVSADGSLLPAAYVHPLITSKNFGEDGPSPVRWAFLPYDRNGKVLSAEAVGSDPHLKAYLSLRRGRLEGRKGSLIGAQIRRGLWWAMMGVGRYSFAPYKVVWEAYGKKSFQPRIFEGFWQVNQSLQAYIPCADAAEAQRVLHALRQPAVEGYLLAHRMEGTMNWAQPGRVGRLLEFTDDDGAEG